MNGSGEGTAKVIDTTEVLLSGKCDYLRSTLNFCIANLDELEMTFNSKFSEIKQGLEDKGVSPTVFDFDMELKMRERLREQLRPVVRDEIYAEVHSDIKSELRNEVKDEVRDEVKEEVRKELYASVKNEVCDELSKESTKEAYDKVRAEIHDTLLEELTEQTKSSIEMKLRQDIEADVLDTYATSSEENLVAVGVSSKVSSFSDIENYYQNKVKVYNYTGRVATMFNAMIPCLNSFCDRELSLKELAEVALKIGDKVYTLTKESKYSQHMNQFGVKDLSCFMLESLHLEFDLPYEDILKKVNYGAFSLKTIKAINSKDDDSSSTDDNFTFPLDNKRKIVLTNADFKALLNTFDRVFKIWNISSFNMRFKLQKIEEDDMKPQTDGVDTSKLLNKLKSKATWTNNHIYRVNAEDFENEYTILKHNWKHVSSNEVDMINVHSVALRLGNNMYFMLNPSKYSVKSSYITYRDMLMFILDILRAENGWDYKKCITLINCGALAPKYVQNSTHGATEEAFIINLEDGTYFMIGGKSILSLNTVDEAMKKVLLFLKVDVEDFRIN